MIFVRVVDADVNVDDPTYRTYFTRRRKTTAGYSMVCVCVRVELRKKGSWSGTPMDPGRMSLDTSRVRRIVAPWRGVMEKYGRRRCVRPAQTNLTAKGKLIT